MARCLFGSAMFKGRRDVCTNLVPSGYLSLQVILGGVYRLETYRVVRIPPLGGHFLT